MNMQRLVSAKNLLNAQSMVLKSSRRALSSTSSDLNKLLIISNESSSNINNKNNLVNFQSRNNLSTNISSSSFLNVLSQNVVAVNLNNTKRFYSTGNLPEHTIIRLPALSPTMEQGTLAKWAKKVGDSIAEGDLIAEIETDKATMGLEATEEGFLAKIFIDEKTRDIPLKTALCVVVRDASAIPAFADFKATEAAEGLKPAASTPAPPPPPPPPSTPAPEPPKPPQAVPQQSQPQQQQQKQPGARVFATPLARKLAAERNIDISSVNPSGPDNQVRAQDVLNFVVSAPATKSTSSASQQQSSKTQYEDIALSNFRAVTAKRLLESKQTIPHYYLSVDFEVDNALKVRADLNEQLAKENIKISLNDLVIKASAMACKKVPEANSHWMDTYIRKYNNVDVCVAVATENGLITPIVFNAEKKGLTSISFDVNALAQRARENKLQPHEFQGGTFTVSNLGMFGIKNFSAVINPPQSCILAVGGIEKRVVPDGKGGHRVASFMSVTLSCDHRVVDGAVGAKWLENFKKFMENPASMLL